MRLRSRGFTLVEILLVLAVVAMVSALVLPAVGGLLRSIDQPEPEQVVWEAVTLARERALTVNREVLLRAGPKDETLSWIDGAETKTFALPPGTEAGFLQARRNGVVLVGGNLLETETLAVVRFFPDGTCDRFRVQLRTDDGRHRVVAVDPWTAAPVLAGEARP